ncbi:MAG TPA: aminotransferase class V-fold PLP-dependent enzyme, partial [Candidatus Deferrimicrobium sp.]|nr:aminotransferase class V-fold PLP-dependent enzyme [Candidatus Deferrimicrobium sp.]
IGKKESSRLLRMPTISFVIKNVKSSTIPLEVDKHKIGIRYGDFYARRLIEDLGLALQDGVVRVSMVHYNTLEEMDRLIKVLEVLI